MYTLSIYTVSTRARTKAVWTLRGCFSGFVGIEQVSTLRQIGMKRPKWPRTLMSISASVGEQWRQRFCQRCAAGLRLAPPKTGQPDKSQATGLPLASKQTQCEAWDAKILCWDAKILDHTCSHAVGFPIRS